MGQEYSLLTTIFYIGYLIAQWPANWLMQRFPIAKVLTITFLLWGTNNMGISLYESRLTDCPI